MLTLFTVGILFLAAMLTAGGFWFVWQNSRAAVSAADHWFDLLRQGRFDAAYALVTPEFKAASSLQVMGEVVTRAGLKDAAPPTWSDREVRQDTAVLAGGLSRPQGTSPLAVMLVRVDDSSWRVRSVLVSPLVGRQMRRFIDIRPDAPGIRFVPGAED